MMSDKIEKLVKLYGKITKEKPVPAIKATSTPVIVKKRETPKPNHR